MKTKSTFRLSPVLALIAALSGLGGVAVAVAASRHEDPHSCCHRALSPGEATRSTARYDLPDVRLLRADGVEVGARREIDDGRPVLLNFVFTTCTTICPVMTRTFARIQDGLGADRDRVHLISVSIDPEHDTPSRLTEYAKSFDAGPQWTFYTGTREASVAMQRAFDVYRGDKMNHPPVTFLRAAPGEPWVRLPGFARAEDVLNEYHRLVAAD